MFVDDMLSVLAGLDGPTGMTLGSLGTTWATPGLPQVKAESRASDQSEICENIFWLTVAKVIIIWL